MKTFETLVLQGKLIYDGIVALIMGLSRAITPGTSVILGADYEQVML